MGRLIEALHDAIQDADIARARELDLTAPQLLAKANGIECVGEERCFWCGAPAEEDYAPPSGFVGWGDVMRQ